MQKSHTHYIFILKKVEVLLKKHDIKDILYKQKTKPNKNIDFV